LKIIPNVNLCKMEEKTFTLDKNFILPSHNQPNALEDYIKYQNEENEENRSGQEDCFEAVKIAYLFNDEQYLQEYIKDISQMFTNVKFKQLNKEEQEYLYMFLPIDFVPFSLLPKRFEKENSFVLSGKHVYYYAWKNFNVKEKCFFSENIVENTYWSSDGKKEKYEKKKEGYLSEEKEWYPNGHLKSHHQYDDTQKILHSYNKKGCLIKKETTNFVTNTLTHEEFFENGLPKSLTNYTIYKNFSINELNGLQRKWVNFPSHRRLESEYYKNGKKDGTCVVYDIYDQPNIITQYREGMKHGREIVNENGKIIKEYSYFCDLLHGECREWNDKENCKIVMYQYGNLVDQTIDILYFEYFLILFFNICNFYLLLSLSF